METRSENIEILYDLAMNLFEGAIVEYGYI